MHCARAVFLSSCQCSPAPSGCPLKTIDNNNKLRFRSRILKNVSSRHQTYGYQNLEQLQYSFICFYTFAPRSFGLAPTANNIIKVDSLRSHVGIVVTLLFSASSFVKTANEKEVKKQGMAPNAWGSSIPL